ncbi:RagB/SusD family nutrient uptake outer membrane protein [Rhodocytophaga rosea]|uniref:RagB/SusD family nutrient uptake outer membrane protein n=1 Tax=Rhodocytophaga rosea TaxID=2704465 RepID=A0A6C0GCA3_9BACT|nr:RagB/SusD family nutrient uptake outer membrane protein [Rhodocytophaga rosea]QHT65527.1 RagB/SusD family nutrient uptake outer membrane protein [Rhodocytophaga rosea]
MKKSIIYKLVIASISVFSLLSGCADKLDVQPVNTVDAKEAVKTSSDVIALLVGAYDAMGDADVYGGNVLRDAELMGDDGEIFWDGTFVAPEEIFRKSLLKNNDQANVTWSDSYEVINIANNVLDNLSVVEEAERERVEGEAKFIRGVMFFELVRTYAPAFTDGNPASNPGVPLILAPTKVIGESAKAARNTVQEVYTQVIADLTSAESLLPESNGFFATTYAAAGMLSRVYMMQQNYQAAADAANRVIDSGEFELVSDYAGEFNNGSNTDEDIFAIQVTSQDGVNEMNTFFGAAEYAGRGDIIIEDAHLAMYEEGDERFNLFYEDESGVIRTGKWINQFGNVGIIRLAEMYLTRAEANFRAGAAVGDTPVNDINVIRERAGLDPLAAVTIDDIMRERRLELAFEGHLIHDIKRTKGSVGDLPYNSTKLVFPIPQRETDVNPNLTQNAGY